MNTRLIRLLTAITLVAPIAGLAAAETVTVTGEVIDSACYIKSGAKGEAHAECATRCAEAGIPLALHDAESGTILWFVSTDHGDATEMLKPYAGQQVQVTGIRHERDGAILMELESVERVQPAD